MTAVIAPPVAPRKPLLDRIAEAGLIEREEAEALLEASDSLGAIGQRLIDGERVKPLDWLRFVAADCNVPLLEQIPDDAFDPAAQELVPRSMARALAVFPLFRVRRELSVAVCDPTDVWCLADLAARTGCAIRPVACPREFILDAIERHYTADEALDDVLIQMVDAYDDDLEIVEQAQFTDNETTGHEAPIIKLVNLIISEAVNARASDIHIEPKEDAVRVRYRVDGYLKNSIEPTKRLQNSIVSRIKIMAGMDIAEKRKPQDGRIKIRMLNKSVDLRVSSLPGIYGEKIVLRLLDPTILQLTLEDLGFSPHNYQCFSRLIESPYGILLVTGPTGSGKSTTLYTCLNRINTPDRNIITIEDPVEYRLGGITQVQVSNIAGLTFAGALRSVLRQDPDIVMLGEMRDQETAETAIRAALTGHLVFSTLHTNDAPGAVTRLLDMGVAPYLVCSSVVGVLAQRLIRVICPNCKESSPADDHSRLELRVPETEPLELCRGVGCAQCNLTGFRNRLAVQELLEMDESLRVLVMERASTAAMRGAARAAGMIPMWEDGLAKVRAGITTLEEVRRVVTLELEG